jgi:Uma2 family endonuclease
METLLLKSEYEIERGKPMPSLNHSIVQGNVYFSLRQKYGTRFRLLPEIRLVLNDTELIPDLAIYNPIEFKAGEDKIRLTELPLGVIEILSPKQNLTDLLVKSHTYFESGVKSYWLILPDLRSVYVFTSPNEYEVFVKTDYLIDDVLNIEIALLDIFQ